MSTPPDAAAALVSHGSVDPLSVSVIVCAYTEDRWTLLTEAIDSVLHQDRPVNEIVLVIDHNPELAAHAAEAFEDLATVHVLKNEEPRGLSGARNTGVRHAAGDILAFLDDDARAHPDWLTSLLEPFTDPAVMGTGGFVAPAWEEPPPRWLPHEFLWVVGASYIGLPLERVPIRNPIGASMAFRAEAFRLAGGFTQGLGRLGKTPLGCEETEFGIRLRQTVPGSIVLYVPDSRVDHHVPRERATWRYFASRCWAEGASKALVTEHVGGSDGLASERSYATRTLPRGVLAGLWAALRGDRSGVARSGAIAAGLAITAAGYLRGRLAIARAPVPPLSFRPTLIRSVELAQALAPITAPVSQFGQPYESLFVLARLKGEPVGLATLALPAGSLAAEQLAEGLWDAIGPQLREHPAAPAGDDDEPLGPATLLRGLSDWEPGRPRPALSPQDAPRVTVIVPTGGRADRLEDCLHSLRALRYPDFDVLVVDNRPSDPATRRVVEAHAREDARVGYTAEARPGSSVARNHGIARTSSPIVAFTDDDVIVDPDWLTALVCPFTRDPDVTATTGLILPGELETHAQWSFEHYRGFGRGVQPRLFDLNSHRADDRPLYPYWGGIFGSGNSMAFRRAQLRAIGGFDPALGAGSLARAGSDVEALSQLVLGGGRIAYEPHAVCWHAHRSDEQGLRRQLFNYGIGLTAIITKWSLRRPSFFVSVLRTVPLVLGGSPAAQPGQRPGLPAHLRRREIMGYALGPLFYLRSVCWARRLRLGDALLEPAGRARDA